MKKEKGKFDSFLEKIINILKLGFHHQILLFSRLVFIINIILLRNIGKSEMKIR